uniref:Uncharacterized protein n=1 Tax=Oryza meridionalis TaxID=40149 RepID=A0A0E0DN47_9ORYZ
MRKEDKEGILAGVEEGEMGIGYSGGSQRKIKRKAERYMGNIISFYLPKIEGNDTFASESDKLSTLRVKRELFHGQTLASGHGLRPRIERPLYSTKFHHVNLCLTQTAMG